MKIKKIFPPVLLAFFVFFTGPIGFFNALAAKDGLKTIAIVPFEIIAAQDLDYVRTGIVHMLHARLSWPDNVMVLPQTQVERKLAAATPFPADEIDEQGIRKLAQATQSDFILTGSITRFDHAFSVDAKIYDIANKRFMAFSQHSEKSDDLIDRVDRIAALINQKVFDRATLTWDKIEQERQANVEKLKRQNPERMMQNPDWQNTRESYGWKIWKYLF